MIGEIQAGAPEEVAENKAEAENAEASEENQETVSASEEGNEVPVAESEAEAEAGTWFHLTRLELTSILPRQPFKDGKF